MGGWEGNGAAIRANHTVSFGYAKRGHLLYPGREHTGKLHTVPISLPQDSAQAIGVKSFTINDRNGSTSKEEAGMDIRSLWKSRCYRWFLGMTCCLLDIYGCP